MGSKVVAIIPARYESTRLPGKPLALIDGKPMVQHVYERARAVRRLDRVLVATDDERIAAAVRGFGGDVVMTRREHPSGTDRIAEVAASLDADVVLNVQGDLPFLRADMVERVVGLMQADATLPMATLMAPVRDAGGDALLGHRHIGLYAYRRDFLLTFARLAPTRLERAEKLEQLRALECGFRIRVAETQDVGIEVDTPHDLERARAIAGSAVS